MLARRPRELFGRSELLTQVFPDANDAGEVDTNDHHVRRKISRDVIRTVRGRGYQLGPDSHSQPWTVEPRDVEPRPPAYSLADQQTAGLSMVGLVVVGAVAFATVVRSQDDKMTQTLTDAAATAGLGGDTDHDHDLSEPRGGSKFAVQDRRGLRTRTGLPAGLPDQAAMQQVATTGASDRRTVHLPTGVRDSQGRPR